MRVRLRVRVRVGVRVRVRVDMCPRPQEDLGHSRGLLPALLWYVAVRDRQTGIQSLVYLSVYQTDRNRQAASQPASHSHIQAAKPAKPASQPASQPRQADTRRASPALRATGLRPLRLTTPKAYEP